MPEYTKPPVLKKISIVFIILVSLVLLLIAYFFIGSANIIIIPSIKPVSATFDILVKENAEAEDSTIEGSVFSKEIDQQSTFDVSDFSREEEGIAKGEIRIVNNNSSAQTLVATTRFITPENILFRLDDRVVVPANSTITATVSADQPGAQGDVSAPLKMTIPGLSPSLQQLVYGEVINRFSGGVKKIGTVSETDITNARKNIYSDILEKEKVNYLSEFLTTHTTSTPVLAPEVLLSFEVATDSSDVVVGDLVDTFTYSMSGMIEGVSFNKNNLEILAQNKLKGSLSHGERFIGVTPGSFEVTIKNIDYENSQALVEVTIAGQSLYTKESEFINYASITNKTKAELIDYFSTIDGVEAVDVTFSPFWVTRVPRIHNNIHIQIEEVR